MNLREKELVTGLGGVVLGTGSTFVALIYLGLPVAVFVPLFMMMAAGFLSAYAGLYRVKRLEGRYE